MAMVGILDVDDELIEEETFDDDCCPICGSYLSHQGLCKVCVNCGWGAFESK